MPVHRKKKKSKKDRRKRSYKLPPGEFKWKPWHGAKCPNIHCEDSREGVKGRSSRRCYTPTEQGHFAYYEVECFDCGRIQFMDVNFRPLRPPEGWVQIEGRWVSPEQQAKDQERGCIMAAKKKAKKKGSKKKKAGKKKKAKGEGIRQVVYFSTDNLPVHKAAAAYAAEQEQSFASVVVEALTSYLEL